MMATARSAAPGAERAGVLREDYSVRDPGPLSDRGANPSPDRGAVSAVDSPTDLIRVAVDDNPRRLKQFSHWLSYRLLVAGMRGAATKRSEAVDHPDVYA